jgi:hypothetical protein
MVFVIKIIKIFCKQKHMVNMAGNSRQTSSTKMSKCNWTRTRTCYNTLLQELRAEDVDEYKNYMRMSKETFNMLLEKVRPYIEKQDSLLSLFFDKVF